MGLVVPAVVGPGDHLEVAGDPVGLAERRGLRDDAGEWLWVRAGSAEAVARRRAEASELQQLRRDNKRLQEENEILRKASAFFARWAEKA